MCSDSGYCIAILNLPKFWRQQEKYRIRFFIRFRFSPSVAKLTSHGKLNELWTLFLSFRSPISNVFRNRCISKRKQDFKWNFTVISDLTLKFSYKLFSTQISAFSATKRRFKRCLVIFKRHCWQLWEIFEKQRKSEN